jgi:hypothetical protein
MKCPKCGLFNPPSALRCDCGWDFASNAMRESYLHAGAGGSKTTNVEAQKPPSSAQVSDALLQPDTGMAQATAGASRRYKVVPFSAAVSSNEGPSHLASQVEGVISSHASSGWEYVGVHQLQTFKAGSSGCFGLGATPSTSITTEFVVFRR